MKITLKAMRVNKGLSQTDVANALGITAKTLQNWEANTTYPDVLQYAKLCALYECGLDDIFLPDKLAKSEEAQS